MAELSLPRHLGQMVTGFIGGKRVVLEIALNVGLLLKENGCECVGTFVHEMAHAADWIFDGGEGHGHTWRRCAERTFC